MQPTTEELKKTYESMRDDQILSLLEEEGMRPEAIKILKDIVKKRGLNEQLVEQINNPTPKKGYDLGRINRKKYFLYNLLFFIIGIPIYSVFYVLNERLSRVEGTQMENNILIITGIALFILTILSLVIGKDRCHDIGHSGFIQLIPFSFLGLLILDGDKGDNEYGPDPLGRQKQPLEREQKKEIGESNIKSRFH